MADSNPTQLEPPPTEAAWSTTVRIWVSLGLAFHLFCVVLSPLATVPPRAALSVQAQQVFSPYSQTLFLQHGYRFFAPEPGPSHVVQYRVSDGKGVVAEGQFPDRDSIWPRQLYHRWFMLSETLSMHVGQTLDPNQLIEWQKEIQTEIDSLRESDPRFATRMESELRIQLAEHHRAAQMRDRLVTDIGQVLLERYKGTSVELKMLTRVLPPPQEIERGLKINANRYLPEELIVNLGTVTLGKDQLESIAPQEDDEPGEVSGPVKQKQGGGGRP